MAELTFIGTATVLLRLGPFTVLTDPNFLHRGQFAYLGKGIVSRRLTEPALSVEDLPELDCVVLSHMHGDHWDRVAKRGLDRRVRILTTPKAARALHRQKFAGAEGLRTWQSAELAKDGHTLSLTAVPGRHARGPARALLPPVMGGVLDHREPDGTLATRLYLTGDTLLIDDLREIPRRFPAIDTAVVHLGGTTLPGGLVVTMDGRQGTDLVELIRPRSVVPVHYDDYGVFKSPLSDFLAEVERRGLAPLVRTVRRGDTVAL
ncbi:MBL fold metallo-hydrolase [Streptomyces sp. NPDC004082]|uniref:MBL fold metallo-hydrolase n=1 Tax=unclassified Streptomyces TaxID=2593676 RepID=UPI0033B1F32C